MPHICAQRKNSAFAKQVESWAFVCDKRNFPGRQIVCPDTGQVVQGSGRGHVSSAFACAYRWKNSCDMGWLPNSQEQGSQKISGWGIKGSRLAGTASRILPGSESRWRSLELPETGMFEKSNIFQFEGTRKRVTESDSDVSFPPSVDPGLFCTSRLCLNIK